MTTFHNRINDLIKSSRVDQVVSHLRTPLYANGYALILSSASTSGLGLLYWTVAAHLYTTQLVGLNSAAISSMMLLGGIAQLNLANVMTRFIPEAGSSTRRMIIAAYLISLLVALVIGFVYVIGIDVFSPTLDHFLDHAYLELWLIISTLCWTVFVVQDGVLTGLRQAIWVPLENTGFALVKILLLVIFALLNPFSGVFASWTVAVILTIVPTNIFIFRVLLPKHANVSKPSTIQRSRILQYATGDYFAALSWLAATTMLPLIVIQVAGADANAYFYLCWTISYSLYLISSNMGSSFIVEAAHDKSKISIYSYKVFIQMVRIVVPLAIVVIVGAPLILRIFGQDYSDQGSSLLRLLALSAIPNMVNSLYVSIARVRGRSGVAFLVLGILSGSALLLSYIFLKLDGITGIGWAWVISQSACAVVLLITQFRPMWIHRGEDAGEDLPNRMSTQTAVSTAIVAEKAGFQPLLRTLRVRPIARGVARKLRAFPITPWSVSNTKSQYRRAEAILQDVLPTLSVSPGMPTPTTWKVNRLIGTVSDVTVAMIGPDQQSITAVLKMPRSEHAVRGLHSHSTVLKTLHSDPRLNNWSSVIPTLLGEGVVQGQTYVVEQAMPGHNARPLLNDPATGARVQVAAAETINGLHQATATVITVDADVFDRWAIKPLSHLRQWNSTLRVSGRYDEAFNRLEAELRRELLGRALSVSWIHGDFWCANLLTTPDGSQITGVVDWELAADNDLPQLDQMQLLLSSRVVMQHRQLGNILVDLLAGAAWLPYEQTILDSAQLPGDAVETRTLLLLSWLRHITANQMKSTLYVDNWFWEGHNIRPVLQHL